MDGQSEGLDPLQERALAWIFGDEEEDPGLVAADLARRPELDPWLAALADDYAALKRRYAPDAAGPALARLAALRDDVARRRAHGEMLDATTAAPPDNVRSLAAARARRSRVGLWVAIGLAAAALVFVVTRPRSAHEVDVASARAIVAALPEDAGFGFAGGAPPSAHDRGFLVGAVIDLSKRREHRSAEPELALARELSDRALRGLRAPEDAEARLQRVLGGCAAILEDASDRSACERGLADYVARRDAFFARR